MAFLELHYHSDALRIGVTVNVILPEKAKTVIGIKADGGETYKTLYLFHGLSDDHSIWMRRTSIERYAADHGIAVVMPSVNRCWYTDTAYGANYFTFVTEELPNVCRSYFRGMSDRREDNLVAGLSMGGRESLYIGLSMPETFGYIGAFTPAPGVLPYNVEKGMFTPDTLKATDGYTPFILINAGDSDGVVGSWPETYSNTLTANGTENIFYVTEGGHDFTVWRHGLYNFVKRIFK